MSVNDDSLNRFRACVGVEGKRHKQRTKSVSEFYFGVLLSVSISLIVDHILGSGTELLVTFNDFVHCV